MKNKVELELKDYNYENDKIEGSNTNTNSNSLSIEKVRIYIPIYYIKDEKFAELWERETKNLVFSELTFDTINKKINEFLNKNKRIEVGNDKYEGKKIINAVELGKLTHAGFLIALVDEKALEKVQLPNIGYDSITSLNPQDILAVQFGIHENLPSIIINSAALKKNKVHLNEIMNEQQSYYLTNDKKYYTNGLYKNSRTQLISDIFYCDNLETLYFIFEKIKTTTNTLLRNSGQTISHDFLDDNEFITKPYADLISTIFRSSRLLVKFKPNSYPDFEKIFEIWRETNSIFNKHHVYDGTIGGILQNLHEIKKQTKEFFIHQLSTVGSLSDIELIFNQINEPNGFLRLAQSSLFNLYENTATYKTLLMEAALKTLEIKGSSKDLDFLKKLDQAVKSSTPRFNNLDWKVLSIELKKKIMNPEYTTTNKNIRRSQSLSIK